MNWKEEKGAMTIVEATFVFPIMFFVLLFLIYMGNMYYMRSQVDSIVTNAAVNAASYCSDPFLDDIAVSGSVPTTIDKIEPYHNILGNNELTDVVRNNMVKDLNNLGTGFFAGMELDQITVNKFKKESSLLSSTFTVDVSYKIQFPIKFLGNDKPTVLNIRSKSTVPITDTPEFILNVDMILDYADSLGVKDFLNEMKSKVGAFFKK